MKGTWFVALLVVVLAEGGVLWPRPPGGKPSKAESTLRLVHVLFRHGNRNPQEGSVWEGNRYQDERFYPEGFDQLTNAGKLTEYNLGKLLRTRYDSFLGDTWNINYVDFLSTGMNRTKMSGLLVMAGLWPPRGSNVWNKELAWQPIPYNYVPLDNDSLLQPLRCPAAFPAMAKVSESPELENYFAERYGETLRILSENTGNNVDAVTALGYFDVLKVQEDIGFPLEEWIKEVYPEPLSSLTVDMYHVFTNTTHLRQIFAGSFVKKILEDSQSFAQGTLRPSSRKLFAYSAHDINVGAVILSLEAFKLPQPPPYGATVIFELHEVRGVWGLKLFYVDYKPGSPHPLAIPGCRHFCPLDEFYSLVEEILPTSDVCHG